MVRFTIYEIWYVSLQYIYKKQMHCVNEIAMMSVCVDQGCQAYTYVSLVIYLITV